MAQHAHPPPEIGPGLRPGMVIADRYEIRRTLASGGMAQIYLAFQRPFGRPVAIKIIRPDHVDSCDVQERFLEEAWAISQLHHPNTVTIFDFGKAHTQRGDLLYIVMEYVEGTTLAEIVRTRGPLPVDEAVVYAIQIAQSLGEAHRKGIIHRDLKPENIMIVRTEEREAIARVLDFGIAKVARRAGRDVRVSPITGAGVIVGTPTYMSPEQAQDLELDGRSDLYALACCLYEMLAGRPVFEGGTALDVMLRHRDAPVPPLDRDDISPDLEAFLERALAKSPDDRPDDARTFVVELVGCFLDQEHSSPLALQYEWLRREPIDDIRGEVSTLDDLPVDESRLLLLDSEADSESTSPERDLPPPDESGDRDDEEKSDGDEEKSDGDEIALAPLHLQIERRDRLAHRPRALRSTIEHDESTGDGATPDEEVDARDTRGAGEDGLPQEDSREDEAARGSDRRAMRRGNALRTMAVAMVGFGLGGAIFSISEESSGNDVLPVEAPTGASTVHTLSIDSSPQGALVSIDGREVGQTPVTYRAEAGTELDVEIARRGFLADRHEGVQVLEDRSNRIYSKLERRVLEIEVRAPVPETHLTVEGEEMGALPAGRSRRFRVLWPDDDRLDITLAPPGHHPYEVSLPAAELDDSIVVHPAPGDFAPIDRDRREGP